MANVKSKAKTRRKSLLETTEYLEDDTCVVRPELIEEVGKAVMGRVLKRVQQIRTNYDCLAWQGVHEMDKDRKVNVPAICPCCKKQRLLTLGFHSGRLEQLLVTRPVKKAYPEFSQFALLFLCRGKCRSNVFSAPSHFVEFQFHNL